MSGECPRPSCCSLISLAVQFTRSGLNMAYLPSVVHPLFSWLLVSGPADRKGHRDAEAAGATKQSSWRSREAEGYGWAANAEFNYVRE